MAGELTLTIASELLKTVYLPRIRQQMNDEASPAQKQIASSSEKVTANQATFSLHLERGSGNGARNEMDDLPEASNQTTLKATVALKYLYGRVKFTGQLMILAKSDAAAFVDAAGFENERMIEDLRYDMSRQFWNDSNAFIAVASGGPTGQVVPFANITDAQWRQVIIGMRVDFGTAANGTAHADSVVVSAVDRTNKTITFVGTVSSVINGSFMRKEDTYTSATKEHAGIPVIVSAADTLYGVSGVTYPRWNAYVNSNSGTLRAPTELLLERALDEVGIEGGKVPNFAVAPHDVVRNYGAQLQSQKRYTDTTELKGGVSALSITSGEATCGLVSDRFAPASTLWFLNSEHLMYHEAADWQWMDEDGAVLSRIPNKHAYEATLFRFCQLATDRRNVHGRVSDLAGA